MTVILVTNLLVLLALALRMYADEVDQNILLLKYADKIHNLDISIQKLTEKMEIKTRDSKGRFVKK